jgi:hypothetical protein
MSLFSRWLRRTGPCRCGHDTTAHSHYTRSTHCAEKGCYCARMRPTRVREATWTAADERAYRVAYIRDPGCDCTDCNPAHHTKPGGFLADAVDEHAEFLREMFRDKKDR